jgi:hypothetical protein
MGRNSPEKGLTENSQWCYTLFASQLIGMTSLFLGRTFRAGEKWLNSTIRDGQSFIP